MALLRFGESEPRHPGRTKSLSKILGIGAVVGVITLGSTFAANINLNSGGNVEFGQGIAQATSCDDNVFVTPQASFVNDAENAAFRFNAFSVTDISDNCFGKTFTIKVYKNGQNSPQDFYDTDGVIFDEIKVVNNNGVFSFTGGGLTSDDIQTIDDGFYVTIGAGTMPSFSLVSGQDVDRITIESSDSNIGYNIGDVGPGGGMIFYVAVTPFTCGPTGESTCSYLEAAPTTGPNAWTDVGISWATDVNDNWYVSLPGAAGTAIGSGYQNSRAIVAQPGNVAETSAAVAARGYTTTSESVNFSDWFLPSQDELYQLYLKRVIVGGFLPGAYWSSTQAVQHDSAQAYFFHLGYGGYGWKDLTVLVRPVRAF